MDSEGIKLRGKVAVECNKCGKLFSKQYLYNHMKLVHRMNTKGEAVEYDRAVKCNDCGKTFSKGYIYTHLKLVHNRNSIGEKVNQLTFTCTLCNKVYKHKHHLKDHINRIHLSSLLDCTTAEDVDLMMNGKDESTDDVDGIHTTLGANVENDDMEEVKEVLSLTESAAPTVREDEAEYEARKLSFGNKVRELVDFLEVKVTSIEQINYVEDKISEIMTNVQHYESYRKTKQIS